MPREKDISSPEFQLLVDPTSAAFFATPVFTMGLVGLSITIKPMSGTLNGYFKLQTTDFGLGHLAYPVTADWVDYPNSAMNGATPNGGAVAATITAAIQWQITDIRSRWLRVVFVNGASSSPVVNVAVSGRAL